MKLLVLGVLLWSAAHFFKRLLPDLRARMGSGGRGLVALLSGVALLLMIFGYRAAPFEPLWQLPSWAIHANNLLMLVAVFLFGMASTTGRLRGRLRHPMLLGVMLWSLAHLLVNGDLASLVLFGGIGLWAVISILLINHAETWRRPAPGPARKDIILIVATIVGFGLITFVHGLIGPSPFG